MKAAMYIGLAAAFAAAVWRLPGGAADMPREAGIACRAPIEPGDLTVVTFTVRAGRIVAECEYANTRPSKPKIGG